MKNYIIILLSVLALSAYSQDKSDYLQFNQLTEIEGTEYVIASVDNLTKSQSAKSKFLLFIDTNDGSHTQVDFPGDGYLRHIEQIKIDSLNINQILVLAKTIDLDRKAGIDWSDPQQLFILSIDGKSKTQLTEDNYFAQTWKVNNETGTIAVTGHYDSNGNGKYDKTDKSEILIFDLKTLELKVKI